MGIRLSVNNTFVRTGFSMGSVSYLEEKFHFDLQWS